MIPIKVGKKKVKVMKSWVGKKLICGVVGPKVWREEEINVPIK